MKRLPLFTEALNPVVVKDLRQLWHRWWLGLGLPAWWTLSAFCAWSLLRQTDWYTLGLIHGLSVILAIVVGAASAMALESNLGHMQLDTALIRAVGYRRYLRGKLITTAMLTGAIYLPFIGVMAFAAATERAWAGWGHTLATDLICTTLAACAVTTQSIIHAGSHKRLLFTLICLPVLCAGVALPLIFRQDLGYGLIEPTAQWTFSAALGLIGGLMIFAAGRVRWYPAYGRRPMHAWFGLPDAFFRSPHHEGAE